MFFAKAGNQLSHPACYNLELVRADPVELRFPINSRVIFSYTRFTSNTILGINAMVA